MRGSAHAQRMRMCADNAPSACIMRECVFCADYAHGAHVRMCGAAQRVQMRSMGICDVRCCAECIEAEPIAGKPKTHHFPSYSRAGGRDQQKTMFFEQPQRKSVLRKSREPYPCHTFRNDAADFSRHRATSKPPMRNAVTLVVLEHVRTYKFTIPAVRVDVRNPLKTLP